MPSQAADSTDSPEPPMGRSYPKVRRVRLRFGARGTPEKYFADDDVVLSHFVANLSGIFPSGEEAFIRSVRRYADQITDPVLKKRVAGFIGQESVHGQEHRRINQTLIEMGYHIAWMDSESMAQKRIWIDERINPRVRLAMTAAAEHYTAVLAQRILTSPEIQALLTDTDIRHLLDWHAYEELEHKSVAFDVYRAIGGRERTRIAVMRTMIALAPVFMFGSLAVSLLRDPIARQQPLRLFREFRRLLRGPMLRGIIADLVQYTRRDFHPDDIDTTELLHQWRSQLFGDTGELTQYLK